MKEYCNLHSLLPYDPRSNCGEYPLPQAHREWGPKYEWFGQGYPYWYCSKSLCSWIQILKFFGRQRIRFKARDAGSIERLNVFLVYPVTHIFRLGRGQFSFHSRRGSCIGIFNLWTEKNPPSQLLKMSDFKLTKVRQYRKQTWYSPLFVLLVWEATTSMDIWSPAAANNERVCNPLLFASNITKEYSSKGVHLERHMRPICTETLKSFSFSIDFANRSFCIFRKSHTIIRHSEAAHGHPDICNNVSRGRFSMVSAVAWLKIVCLTPHQ